MRTLLGPARLFRTVAVAEAVTWALLLVGMVLKYVTETTELGVRVFGLVHGVAFITYGLATLVCWVDQRWTWRRGVLGLLAAVPPFATLWFDRDTERRGHLAPTWRLAEAAPRTAPERLVAGLLARPARAGLGAAAAILALTLVALAVGPPVG